MDSIEKLKLIGAMSVRKHRLEKLSSGQSFLINSKSLPDKQSYLEFPDHKIKIVSVAPGGRYFNEIRVLSETEAQAVRLKYNLL